MATVGLDTGTESLVRVATCNLNQWALDFDLNLRNIMQSIREAKQQGCTFRLGSELEISGYGCQDHFLEHDTFLHTWQSIATILESGVTDGILCSIGAPILHNSVRYNCFLWILNSRIVLIRPKMFMADDGNYRESRWFTSWHRLYETDLFQLPDFVQKIHGQTEPVMFGAAYIQAADTSLASETCEELWTPMSAHIQYGLNGVEIFANGSGSHHNLRKLNKRVDLMRSASAKSGGVYMYANQQGCDGGRLYYDGSAMVCVNGDVVAQGTQFSLSDVEVVVAVVNLEDVRSARGGVSSRGIQATQSRRLPFVSVDFRLTVRSGVPHDPIEVRFHTPEEEIGMGPPCWLWDYLRRSGAGGYFLPLSGGADSSSTAAMVGIMCNLVVQAVANGNQQVLADARRIADQGDDYIPTDPKEFASHVLHTCYMGTENSSSETKNRAKRLSEQVGFYHLDCKIDTIVEAVLKVFQMLTGKRPKFKVHGGTTAENLALQNIQARLRMVLSYVLAQLLPWVRGKKGFLLVLGSANVDEALRGYMTKYDCSSADINPIGGIAKGDLKRFLVYAGEKFGWKALIDVVKAKPTAELEPITENYTQNDEDDMGMTYEELGIFGRLRNLSRCGPVSMFQKLVHKWGSHLSPTAIADKVKHFFFCYSITRHKLTTLTPSYHAENYSPDDNRFDHRQFLYNARWTRQFNTINELVKRHKTAPSPNRDPTMDPDMIAS